MADIAKIGFAADTSALKDAKADLNAIIPAAANVEKASDKVAAAIGKVDTAADKMGAAASGATAPVGKLASALEGEAIAAKAAAGANVTYVGSLKNAVMGTQDLNSHVAAYRTHMAGASKATKLTAADMLNLGRQGADVGVTLAMGMNPFMIAIQQGPQILDALQVAAIRTGTSVGAVLKALAVQVYAALAPFLPIIAAIATGIALLASGFALGARSINENNKDIVAGLGLTEKQLEKVKEKGVSTTVTIGDTFKAFAQVSGEYLKAGFDGPLKWLADAFKWTFDTITEMGEGAIKLVVGVFAGGLNAIKMTWKSLPGAIGDLFISMANLALKTVENMINGFLDKFRGIISLINKIDDKMGQKHSLIPSDIGNVSLGQFKNPLAGQMKETGQAAGDAFIDGFDRALTGIDGFFDAVGKRAIKNRQKLIQKAAGDVPKAPAPATGKTDAEKFSDITGDAQRNIVAMMAERDAVNMTADAAATLKFQTDLLNKAGNANLTLTQEQTAQLQALGARMGEIAAQTGHEKGMKELNADVASRLKGLQDEAAQVSMTADEVIRYRNEQNLLAQARAKNIDLTPAEVSALHDAASAMSEIEIRTRDTKDALEFARGTTKGFVTDLIGGLKQGQSVWESFGNAVINVLNKIADKLLDQALDSLLGGGSGGGGGGFLSSLISAGMSFFGGGGNGLGSQFGGVDVFAKGDAFGVVSKPSIFTHAGGVGVMGEAGPEAVMPLQRGPDGSLGVQMYGTSPAGGGDGETKVDVNNHFHIAGAVSSKDVINMIKQSAENTKDEVRRSISNWQIQSERDGAIV